jgi:hypothetical protein
MLEAILRLPGAIEVAALAHRIGSTNFRRANARLVAWPAFVLEAAVVA